MTRPKTEKELFVEAEIERLLTFTKIPDLALDARVKALQEKANNRPEYVEHRASPEYHKRYFSAKAGE